MSAPTGQICTVLPEKYESNGTPSADPDLLLRAAVEQFDERVAGDLLGEPGAPGALDAALPVQQHLGGQRDRLRERPLRAVEPGLALAGGHGLVLQRALAALVAHRAVQRVVHQQQLHHAALRLLRHRRSQLGTHHHAIGAGGGARGGRLGLALDVHQALPAGTDRVEQRVVAEPGYLDAQQLRGPDHQGALGHGDLEPVDSHGDPVGRPGDLPPGPWLPGRSSGGLHRE